MNFIDAISELVFGVITAILIVILVGIVCALLASALCAGHPYTTYTLGILVVAGFYARGVYVYTRDNVR
jgi:ABC-type polysaccharide/polyol phosphate export permease